MKTISTPPPVDFMLRTLDSTTVGRVDSDKRKIYGVAVIQLGTSNDSRQLRFDAETLNRIIEIGNGGTKNLKARWSHPNLSSDGLGKYLGRWSNFRMSDDGSTVLADLQLSDIAFRSVDAKLGMSRGEWVLEMAQNDHDAFGVSVAPSKMDLKSMEDEEDREGFQPYRPLGLTAIDVVDDPASTRGGLFGGMALSVEDAPQFATEALDKLFPEAEPEVIRARAEGFLDKYLLSRFGSRVVTTGATDMADTNKAPEAITQEQLTATLDKFGEGLLGKVDEKISAIAKQATEEEQQELSQKEVRDAESKRCQELYALAKNAGISEWEKKADDWIGKGLSAVEAKAAIADIAIANNGLSSDGGEEESDPYKKFRQEFQRDRETLSTYGIEDEDAYVRSRCRDEGILPPAVKS